MKSRRLNALSVGLAAIFGLSGIAILSGAGFMVEQFDRWGYPESFMMAIGVFELIGAVGLLVPKIASVAALGLALLMLGAIYTHLFRGFAPLAMVPALLIGALGYIAKRRLKTRQSWILRQRELF